MKSDFRHSGAARTGFLRERTTEPAHPNPCLRDTPGTHCQHFLGDTGRMSR